MWPTYARILWDGFSVTPDNDVHRTEFDDGTVRQAKSLSRVLRVRAFDFQVKASDKAAFNTWLEDNTATSFGFWDTDDEMQRTVKIRGGQGNVPMVADGSGARYDGERFWRGHVELEGYW